MARPGATAIMSGVSDAAEPLAISGSNARLQSGGRVRMGAAKPEWNFERVSRMGGATGTAFRNTLQGAGISGEEELAREAIQNSCDAVRNGQRVRVVFRMASLMGREANSFAQSLGLVEGFAKHQKHLQLPRSHWLSKQGDPLPLVFVEDYGTVGLSGDPHSRESNFYKLLLSMGDVSKAAQSRTGGSYGYGKAALSANSRLYTIVAYSSFPKDSTGATARLMACGYFAAHDIGSQGYSGRAWWGLTDQSDSNVTHPLEGAEAHEFAERVGFKRRGGEEHGTSLLLVDSTLEPTKLLRGIENSWWPRIIDQDLEIEVLAGGKGLFPKPKQRKDLMPFIECYELCKGAVEPAGVHQRLGEFNQVRGIATGTYALQVIGESRVKEFDDDQRVGTIALMRSPRMVVDYPRVARDSPPAVGVFVADPAIDEILKLSEPPTHNRWDEKSTRLVDAIPDEETARMLVGTLHRKLRDQIRKLQVQVEPPRPPEATRLRALERELGLLLKPMSRDGGGGDQNPAPIEVRFDEDPRVVESKGGLLETRVAVSVKLRDDADEHAADAILRVRVAVLEDEEEAEGDLLPIVVTFSPDAGDDVEELESDKGERRFQVSVTKDRWVSFTIRSGPYDAQWATKVGVELEAPGGEP